VKPIGNASQASVKEIPVYVALTATAEQATSATIASKPTAVSGMVLFLSEVAVLKIENAVQINAKVGTVFVMPTVTVRELSIVMSEWDLPIVALAKSRSGLPAPDPDNAVRTAACSFGRKCNVVPPTSATSRGSARVYGFDPDKELPPMELWFKLHVISCPK